LPSSSALADFKNAAYARGLLLWPANTGVQVAFGHPGVVELNDLVAFTDVSGVQEPVTFGTSRSRDEELELTVMYSVFRAGGPEMEKVAFDRAVELQDDFETYVRATDTTLGGVVRHCFLTSLNCASILDGEVMANGRLVEIEAKYSAVARVRTS
jgi:hypothetical protein